MNTGLNTEETRLALIELCERGLLTCTRGEPGERGSTYALGWLPLDRPERFPDKVRERHAENMRRLDKQLQAPFTTGGNDE